MKLLLFPAFLSDETNVQKLLCISTLTIFGQNHYEITTLQLIAARILTRSYEKRSDSSIEVYVSFATDRTKLQDCFLIGQCWEGISLL